jgi:hypothetical protein
LQPSLRIVEEPVYVAVLGDLQDLGTSDVAVAYQQTICFRKFPHDNHACLRFVTVKGGKACMVKGIPEISNAVMEQFPSGFEYVFQR